MNTHGHEHSHLAEYGKNSRVLAFVLVLTASVMLVEFFGGFISGSLALISDAGHMLTDAGSLALALFALWFSRRPATPEKTYGFFRLEILAALVNGALLFGLAVFIFYEAFQRFYQPVAVQGTLMLVIAGVGLVVNLVSAFILSRTSHENLNVRAALWHVLSDALSSLGVIAGGLIIISTGQVIVDPLISCFIGLLIVRGAWFIVIESVEILLEGTPRDVDFRAVQAAIEAMPGVREAHDIHIWTITTGLRSMSAHILVEDALVSKCGDISKKVKDLLHDKFNIAHATLEFECENCAGNNVCKIK